MRATIKEFAAVFTAAVCAAIMASCTAGGADQASNHAVTTPTYSSSATTQAAETITEPTAAQTTAGSHAAATEAQAETRKETVKEPVAEKKSTRVSTTAKTTKKAAQTTKKAVSKPKTTAKAKGLTDADVRWAQKKANEYIATLPKAFVQEDAKGFFGACGIPENIKTKEQLLNRFKEDINYDYDVIINSEGNLSQIGMYCGIKKDKYGWEYCIYNEAWM